MKCFYEVLGVEKDADDDALKKAYRRMALVWHPDKNQHRIDEAHAAFQEIQNAYEVLSDKHERAWYDSHRNQILRSGERHQAGGGGGGFTPGQRPDDEVDLFQYFNASCYSGFGDGPQGFYGVYSELFSTLAQQEVRAAEDAGSSAAAAPPPFGASTSEAAEVYGFYNWWGAFASVKEFAWADLYNPASAPNRQVRRKMEDENRKARRAAKRTYNENVRELVAFVKKRDKRMARFQAEEAARRQEREAAEAARRAAEREERLRRAAQYQEPDWARGGAEGVGSQASSSEEGEEEEEEELSVDEFYCVVCEKRFRSAGQLANHERSRKHQEALAALREVLEEEEAALLLEEKENPAAAAAAAAAAPVEGAEEGVTGPGGGKGRGQMQEPAQQPRPGARSKKARKQQRRQQQQQRQQEPELSESSSEQEPEEVVSEGARSVSPSPVAAAGPARNGFAALGGSESGSSTSEDEDEDSGTSGSGSDSNSRQQERSGGAGTSASDSAQDSEDEDAMLARLMGSRPAGGRAPASSSSSAPVKGRKQQGKQAPPVSATAAAALSQLDLGLGASSDDELLPVNKARNNKGRKGQKAGGNAAAGAAGPRQQQQQQPAAADASSEEEGPLRGRGSHKAVKADKRAERQQRKAQAAAAAAGLLCSVCGVTFESRNQLFKHISATGHAALKG